MTEPAKHRRLVAAGYDYAHTLHFTGQSNIFGFRTGLLPSTRQQVSSTGSQATADREV